MAMTFYQVLLVAGMCGIASAFTLHVLPPTRLFPLQSTKTPMNEALQAAAVRRFTIGYNKLCKNCPTRLQPRVDTLTEMIMGLSVDDRNDLLEKVAQREKSQTEKEGLRTPEHVYNFQVTGSTNGELPTVDISIEKKIKPTKKQEKTMDPIDVRDKKLMKLSKKKQKVRGKLQQNDKSLVRAKRLFDAATLFLTQGQDADLPPVIEKDLSQEIAALRIMSRQELQLKCLEYVADKAKREYTKAKSRVKQCKAKLEMQKLSRAIVLVQEHQ